MSSDDVQFMALSDSSDEIGFLDQYSTKINVDSRASTITRPNLTNVKPNSASDAEPDWVRDHTPQKTTDFDRKEALLAALADEDDDDSIIDLIDDEGPTKRKTSGETTEANKVEPDESHQNTAMKRARVPAKPKSKLPLVVAPKLDDSLVLLQSMDGKLDLSGDVGAVGRVKMQQGELFLDIKGVVYRTIANPCNSLCVVSVGEEEARVTAVLEEAVVLSSERNLFASDELLVHGELEEEDAGETFQSQSGENGKEGEVKKLESEKKRKNGSVSGKKRAKAPSKRKALPESKQGRILKPPRSKR